MGISKVTLDGNTLMDLSSVTVTESHLDEGYTAHGNNGDLISGTVRPNRELEILQHTVSGFYEDKTITSIRGRAFNAATNLTSVSFPSVITMGTYVFNGCTNLESVAIPNLTSVSNYAFYGCSKLKEASFNEAATIGNYAFYNCSSMTNAVLPEVTNIPTYAFYNNSKLSSIETGAVTSIYSYAFYNCKELTSLPSSLTNSVVRIGDQAFQNCTSLVSINFPSLKGDTGTDYKHGNGMFRGCTSLTTASIPKAGYFRNKGEAFRDCTALVSVDLKGMTAYYGQGLFYNCTSLPLVVLPSISGGNANYNMCQNWFYNCTSLHTVDINNPYAVQTNTFQKASAFKTFLIRGTARTTTLDNISAFTGTPFASSGSGGTFYVRNSKINAYRSATNWSSVLAYANNMILPIEGSEYQIKYADGTAISGAVLSDPEYWLLGWKSTYLLADSLLYTSKLAARATLISLRGDHSIKLNTATGNDTHIFPNEISNNITGIEITSSELDFYVAEEQWNGTYWVVTANSGWLLQSDNDFHSYTFTGQNTTHVTINARVAGDIEDTGTVTQAMLDSITFGWIGEEE